MPGKIAESRRQGELTKEVVSTLVKAASTPSGQTSLADVALHLPVLRQRLKIDLGYSPAADDDSKGHLKRFRNEQLARGWLSWSFSIGLLPFGAGLLIGKYNK